MRRIGVFLLLWGCTAGEEITPKEVEERVPEFRIHQEVARRGDVFSTVVGRLGVDSAISARFVKLLAESVKVLKVGDTLRVVGLDGKPLRLELRRAREIYEYWVDGDRFVKKRRFRRLTPRYVEMEVETTLWDEFVERGLSPMLLVNLVNIFAWKIDFSTETQRGDSLRVLFAPDGTVYYAEYVGKSVGRHVVVRFRGAYYDEEGNSIRMTFLKSPLRSYRITSGFGIRFHPILKKWRPHHGIDYAAPYGTPVRSVADGRVVFAGWRGGYGKTVIVKHKNGYSTLYGHLARIFVKRGQHVSQGQVIGSVGSTGLSTGPHLHYEVRQHGRRINPALIKAEPEKPLPEDLKDEFRSMLQEYRRLIKALSLRLTGV